MLFPRTTSCSLHLLLDLLKDTQPMGRKSRVIYYTRDRLKEKKSGIWGFKPTTLSFLTGRPALYHCTELQPRSNDQQFQIHDARFLFFRKIWSLRSFRHRLPVHGRALPDLDPVNCHRPLLHDGQDRGHCGPSGQPFSPES